MVADRPTYRQKAGRSGRDFITEQKGPMGIVGITVGSPDALGYEMLNPGKDQGDSWN